MPPKYGAGRASDTSLPSLKKQKATESTQMMEKVTAVLRRHAWSKTAPDTSFVFRI